MPALKARLQFLNQRLGWGNERKLYDLTTSLIMDSDMKMASWKKKKHNSAYDEINRTLKF